MYDATELIQRLRVAIYDLGVQTVICATTCTEANQRRLDESQARVDAVIQEVADALAK
jgi:hypothetical protein